MPDTRAAVGDSLTNRWTAGIDWVTWIYDGDYHHRQAREVADEIVSRHATPLDRRGDFKLLRWEGWRIGAVRVGHSEASSLVQLSGRVADESWTLLPLFGGRPSRLDVQTTVQLSHSQPQFARRFLEPSSTTSKRLQSTLPRNGFWSDSRGSALGTVGDRAKARYLRVYDKGTESKRLPPGYLWRIEVEAKKALAPKLFADLTSTENVTQWCYDTCAEQWKRSGYSWPLSGSSRGREGLTVPADPVPDAERLMLWLQTSVAPTIRRLSEVYSREQLLYVLGLSEGIYGLPGAREAAGRHGHEVNN